MTDYGTCVDLNEQLDVLTETTKKLYDAWMELEVRNTHIINRFSQTKLLVKLCEKIRTRNYTDKQLKAIDRRLDNLDRRSEKRFEIEYPAETIETLKAYNDYLLSKSKLNGLRLSYKAYHHALIDT